MSIFFFICWYTRDFFCLHWRQLVQVYPFSVMFHTLLPEVVPNFRISLLAIIPSHYHLHTYICTDKIAAYSSSVSRLAEGISSSSIVANVSI